MKVKVPQEVEVIGKALAKAGHRAYLVGGCVRDLFLGREPKDWDVATGATPDVIQKVFPESVYENQFGTVGVKTDSENERLKVIEVTTFRVEGEYTDRRHPDQVDFAASIEADLERRDFTMNALAMDMSEDYRLVDIFGGRDDIKKKMVRAVGNPKRRFEEDALRLMRAVRFAAELGFEIDKETIAALRDQAALLELIAKERIRDELVKMIMTDRAAEGIVLLEDMGLLRYVLPELREGIGCGQNKHHIYTVFDHNVRALNYTAEKKYPFEIRLAALLHDVGKPRTKAGDGPNSTFYNHETVGARMAAKMMDRLHFSKETTEKVVHLVRSHLFYYNVGEVTEAGVRRFLVRVGPENVDDLLKVREADRIGSGVPKAFPYKLRHLLFMIDKVKTDPIHPKMLKVNGEAVMKILKIGPGPKIGRILAVLLEEVLDDPGKNVKDILEKRVMELGRLSEEELEEFADRAREKKNEFEGGLEEEMKKRHHVK